MHRVFTLYESRADAVASFGPAPGAPQ
jgi:hypothetical protein